MEQHGSHWADFHEIWYLSIFRKCAQKIQVPLKSDKTLHEDQFTLLSYLAGLFLEWEMFHKEVLEKIETHTLHIQLFIENLPRLRQCGKIWWESDKP